MTSKINKSISARRSLLGGASALAAAAAAVAGSPAMAQDIEEEEAIVVTGTRLVRQDFEAISPITTVGSEQLELTATLTTESLLNELPQIVPGNTRTSNNAGGFDFATVDLRGLGPGRTLVLMNGERVPVSSTAGAVDINTIPASLISRIEVVTGGASAVYGSDAMAGVINFVLKDDYEGAEVTVTHTAELETGNAAEFEINGLVGGNFANGRGNMTAYASYFDREGVMQSEYDYSRVSGAFCYDDVGGNIVYSVCDSAAEAAAHGGLGAPGGSGTPPWGWITNDGSHRPGPDGVYGTGDDIVSGNPFNPAALAANSQFSGYDHDCNPATANIAYGQIAGPGKDGILGTADDVFAGQTSLSFNDAGALEPRNTNGACGVPDRAAGSSRYNFAPDNFLVIPAERVALTTSGHYDITDSLRLNVMINYANSRTQVQLAPTPATGLSVTLTPAMQTLISTEHPDLWTALLSRPDPDAPFTVDRRMSEVGARTAFFESNNFYFLSGLEGALGENWDWNLSASYGQVMFNSRSVNSVNRTALMQGLAGCEDPNSGLPLGAAALPGCVPLDIFGPGTLTDEMASFIRVNTFQDTHIEESRIAGFVRGDLFELPAGGVAAVFGFEYRDTFAGQYVDNEQRTGNIFGFNAIQDQEGQIDVYELYTEVSVPLVSEAPLAHYLGLEAGYRRSNYSTIGNVDTYKIGGEWAPTEWLRFRAMFNEATRAPNVFEVFQAGDQGFPPYTDPCRDPDGDGVPNGVPNQTAPTAAFCIGQGVPAGLLNGFVANNSQVEAFAFGNPNLGPETAETMTYGLVFTPDWFPVGDLRASIDYYDIEITDVIAGLPAMFFINDCYSNGNAASCARVVRDTVTGQIDFVNTSRANQGAMTTDGYDIQVEWSAPVGPGRLAINELYSILESFTLNGNEFAGTTSAGIGSAFPEYKSVLSVSYEWGDWTLFSRWNYVPEVRGTLTGPSANCNGVPAGEPNCTYSYSPEASYVDVSARWNVTDAFTVTANVDNVFDDYPPQTVDGAFGGQANTDPQVYRVLGRTFSISGRYRF